MRGCASGPSIQPTAVKNHPRRSIGHAQIDGRPADEQTSRIHRQWWSEPRDGEMRQLVNDELFKKLRGFSLARRHRDARGFNATNWAVLAIANARLAVAYVRRWVLAASSRNSGVLRFGGAGIRVGFSPTTGGRCCGIGGSGQAAGGRVRWTLATAAGEHSRQHRVGGEGHNQQRYSKKADRTHDGNHHKSRRLRPSIAILEREGGYLGISHARGTFSTEQVGWHVWTGRFFLEFPSEFLRMRCANWARTWEGELVFPWGRGSF